jgi:hypothetical protein
MSDSRSDDPYAREVQALLADAVRDELAVSVGIQELDLSSDAIDRLAQAIASRIDYAFRFTWDPSWLSTGEPHVWSEDGNVFARCTACLAVSQASSNAGESSAWHDEHRRSHGG